MGRHGKNPSSTCAFLQSQDSPDLPTGHYKVKLCQASLRKVRRAVTREAEASAVLSSSSGATLLLFATAAPDKQRESLPKYPVTSDHAVPPEGAPRLSALVLLKPGLPPVNTCPDPSDHPGIPNCCLLTINWLRIKRKTPVSVHIFPLGCQLVLVITTNKKYQT